MTANWQDRAACKDRDGDLFFDDNPQSRRHALAICAGCSVRAECLDFALEHGEHGVWGGTTAGGRRGMATARRRLAVCGTDGGYYHHRYLKEPTCPACRAAHSLVTSIRDANPVRNAGKRARYTRLRDLGWCNWCAGGQHDRCLGCLCDRPHRVAS